MGKYLTAIFFFLSVFVLSAQKIDKYLYLKHSTKQDGLSFQFTVLEDDKHGVWIYDKSKFYYWFKAQKVLSTQGGSSGLLLHGNFESFYENKQLAQKGSFHKGLKNGEWKYWRENGTLLKVENWKKGRQAGEEIIYNEKGEPIATTCYKRNGFTRKTADSLIVSNFKGTKKTITTFDAQGKITSKTKYNTKKSSEKPEKEKDKSETPENTSPEKKKLKDYLPKLKKKEGTTEKTSEKKKINWKFWKKKES